MIEHSHKIYDKRASEILEIVKELESSGLVKGHDFDFAYTHPTVSNDRRFTVFTFSKAEYCTFFAIKYS